MVKAKKSAEVKPDIRITRFRPSTCACIIEFSWDMNLGPQEQTHTAHRVVDVCPKHKNLAEDKEALFEAIKQDCLEQSQISEANHRASIEEKP